MSRQSDSTHHPSTRIGPGDDRYRAVVDKRFNKRFTASPDYVLLASSTDNHARLQRVKYRYDPLNVFHHALSIRAQ